MEGNFGSASKRKPTPLSYQKVRTHLGTFFSFEQKSRRYLGNKYRLIEFIQRVVANRCPDYVSFADIFAGTGVVGAAFNSPKISIIANDLLFSNYVSLQSFFGIKVNSSHRIQDLIDHLNHLESDQSNYFSKNFGGRYFTDANAKKIGTIRDEIDKISDNEDEKNILLCSLLYAVDKVANTVGHYDAFRQNVDTIRPIELGIPQINIVNNINNQIFCKDANSLVEHIDCDVLYLDPPYNSRQYSDAYHLLENLVSWSKPPVSGIARKMDRSHIKSQYCLIGAADAFAKLIEQASCRHILLSYNNTGCSMNSRSNARITDDEITGILSSKGRVEVFSQDHRAFTTGKSSTTSNSERIFYCQVAG